VSTGSQPESEQKPALGALGSGLGRVPRFWVQGLPDTVSSQTSRGIQIELAADEARHAVKVLRLAEGARVQLFDGAGAQAEGRVVSTGKGRASVEVQGVSRVAKPACGVVVASAVPKGARAEDMVDQLSQIGVIGWQPVVCERGVVEATDGKRARLERRALQSCKQCGRPWVMQVGEKTTVAELLSSGLADCWLMMDTEGDSLELVIEQSGEFQGEPENDVAYKVVGLLVGPEGGWTDSERQAIQAVGVTRFNLPMPVMRIETAALAGAAVMIQQLASLGEG